MNMLVVMISSQFCFFVALYSAHIWSCFPGDRIPVLDSGYYDSKFRKIVRSVNDCHSQHYRHHHPHQPYYHPSSLLLVGLLSISVFFTWICPSQWCTLMFLMGSSSWECLWTAGWLAGTWPQGQAHVMVVPLHVAICDPWGSVASEPAAHSLRPAARWVSTTAVAWL